MMLTPEKVAAVKALSVALILATESGLLDAEMWDYMDPMNINEFCDAVTGLEAGIDI